MQFCLHFNCIAICPEMAIGLGVPRTPISVILSGNQPGASANNVARPDITEQLLEYATRVHLALPDLCGYIFKSRSPSCGVQSTACFDTQGRQIGMSSGIFSGRIMQLRPGMPVIEEHQIWEATAVKEFANAVKDYALKAKQTR